MVYCIVMEFRQFSFFHLSTSISLSTEVGCGFQNFFYQSLHVGAKFCLCLSMYRNSQLTLSYLVQIH